MKVCSKCKVSKEKNEFSFNKTKNDGYYPRCKLCEKKRRNCIEYKEHKRLYDIEYGKKNVEKLKLKRKIYQKTIPNEIRSKQNREYHKKHPEKYHKMTKTYREKHKHIFTCRSVLFNFIRRSGMKKTNTTFQTLGYNFEQFKQRIEFNFKEGMSWKNHGEWHIDHIKPISKFKEGTPARIVNLLSNLQPLWAKDNLSKGNNFILNNKEYA